MDLTKSLFCKYCTIILLGLLTVSASSCTNRFSDASLLSDSGDASLAIPPVKTQGSSGNSEQQSVKASPPSEDSSSFATQISESITVEDQQNAGLVTAPEQPLEMLQNKQQADTMNAEIVEVEDRILFPINSDKITPEAMVTLRHQAEWLKSDSSINIMIEGHCDERGTREYNLALGERRANAAKKALISLGIEPSRIQTISYGKEKPDAVGGGEDTWLRNRRSVTVMVE